MTLLVSRKIQPLTGSQDNIIQSKIDKYRPYLNHILNAYKRTQYSVYLLSFSHLKCLVKIALQFLRLQLRFLWAGLYH